MAGIIETARVLLAATVNAMPLEREELEKKYGKDNVWDTTELQETFEVKGFAAPFCVVTKKDTGEKGAVIFQHMPRFYFAFQPSK